MKSGSDISIWHAQSVLRLTAVRKQDPRYRSLTVWWLEEMLAGGLLTDASGKQSHSRQRAGESSEVCAMF